LEELLCAEFTPVVDVLVDAAKAELDAHVVITLQRFLQLVRDIMAMLNRRRLDLEANRQDQAKRNPGAVIQEYLARQGHLEQRIEDCARIAAALKLLARRCAALGSAAAPFSSR
jgi:sigma54-dependent transcription regulator